MNRYTWKTIRLLNSWEILAIEGAYLSSKNALGKSKVFNITKSGGGGEIETNVTWANIKLLFSHAGVRIPWRNGVLYDTKPSWEVEEL